LFRVLYDTENSADIPLGKEGWKRRKYAICMVNTGPFGRIGSEA
jgi:hypothetical protein